MARKKSYPAAHHPAAEGFRRLLDITLLKHMETCFRLRPDTDHRLIDPGAWCAISPKGTVYYNPACKATPERWLQILGVPVAAACLGLVYPHENLRVWEITVLLLACQFMSDLGYDSDLPEALCVPDFLLPPGGEKALFARLEEQQPSASLLQWRAAWVGAQRDFLLSSRAAGEYFPNQGHQLPHTLFKQRFGESIRAGLVDVIARSATGSLPSSRHLRSEQCKQALINRYPLLGGLAASFEIVHDIQACQARDIAIAAIDSLQKTIWINPLAALKDEEMVFVIAHELLHAGLNHASRRKGRDRFLWNVACDFVINDWLKDMQVGQMPPLGLLYDPALKQQSAETIYDDLAKNIRKARKLATLRGSGLGDILGDADGLPFVDAETYCRAALAQGLVYYDNRGGQRGTLPLGLVEEILILNQPPIPWDTQLAQWFEQRFLPENRERSYSKPSRRQSATPNIPRPALRIPPEQGNNTKTFAVILDTSGSMSLRILGSALGAIASYALAHDVGLIRLICCDAAYYDMGWVEPENLQHRFSLRGRGGTELQPGIDHLTRLSKTGQFPPRGSVLIITDGYCENHLNIPHDHAFLLPEGRRLPFSTTSQIFWMK